MPRFRFAVGGGAPSNFALLIRACFTRRGRGQCVRATIPAPRSLACPLLEAESARPRERHLCRTNRVSALESTHRGCWGHRPEGWRAISSSCPGFPARPGAALIVVQHLDPRESLLPEILTRKTPMPVIAAAEGVAVEPDHIYVIPPKRRVDGGRGRPVSSRPGLPPAKSTSRSMPCSARSLKIAPKLPWVSSCRAQTPMARRASRRSSSAAA